MDAELILGTLDKTPVQGKIHTCILGAHTYKARHNLINLHAWIKTKNPKETLIIMRRTC